MFPLVDNSYMPFLCFVQYLSMFRLLVHVVRKRALLTLSARFCANPRSVLLDVLIVLKLKAPIRRLDEVGASLTYVMTKQLN